MKTAAHPVSDELRAYDPLRRGSRRASHGILALVLTLVGAAIVHIAIVVLLFGVAHALSTKRSSSAERRIEVAVVERSRPPVDNEVAPAEPAKDDEPTSPAPPPKKREAPSPKAPEPPPPPPDPINLEEQPKAEETEPRRVVGLSFASTVRGGSGAAFAVGNTRMGATSETAENPDAIARVSPVPLDPNAARTNQPAAYIPNVGAKIEQPRRVREVKPEYPETYRRDEIEGEVVVRVTIDVTGKVVDVAIVAPSRHNEFNRAAKEAAHREQFEPATKDGVPIPFSITFTYRFRLSGG